MADLLYYIKAKRQPDRLLGPVNKREVRDLIVNGKVDPDDQVTIDQVKWIPLSLLAPQYFQSVPVEQSVANPQSARLQQTQPESSQPETPVVEEVQSTSTADEKQSEPPATAVAVPPPLPSQQTVESDAVAEGKSAESAPPTDVEATGKSVAESEKPPVDQAFSATAATHLSEKLTEQSRTVGRLAARLARRANSSLRPSALLADLNTLLAWQPSDPARIESRRTTILLLILGVGLQISLFLLSPFREALGVQILGLALTPVYAAAHFLAAMWLCHVAGSPVTAHGPALQRELSCTGLLMVAGGLTELAFWLTGLPRPTADFWAVMIAAPLFIHVKCLLYFRFLMRQANIPEPHRIRFVAWGTGGLLTVMATSMLMIATTGAMLTKTQPSRPGIGYDKPK